MIAPLLLLLETLLDRLAALSAVPADEFAPAIILFQARPFLPWAALLLWSLRLFRSGRGRPLRTPWREVAATPLLLAAAAWPAVAPTLVGVVSLLWLTDFLRSRSVPVPAARAAVRLEPAGPALSRLLQSAGLGVAITALVECVCLRRHLPNVASDLSASAFVVSRIWFVLAPLAAATLAMSFILLRWLSICTQGARVVTAFVSLLNAVGVAAILRGCLGDEISALGVWPPVLAALGWISAGSLASRHRRSELAAPAARLPQFFGSPFSWWPIPPLNNRADNDLGDRPSWRRAWVLTLAASVFTLSNFALWPSIEDLRLRLYPAFAILSVVAAISFVSAATRSLPQRYSAAALAIFLASVGLFGGGWSGSLRGRIALHENSRLATLLPWMGLSFGNVVDSGSGDVLPKRPELLSDFIVGSQDPFTAPGTSSRDLALVMVLWDAARPDRMGTYGHVRATTPNLQTLANDAAVFTRARSNATATTLGVRCLMTGQYSSRCMVSEDHGPFVVKDLSEAGTTDFVITVTGSDFNGVSAEAFHRHWDSRQPGLQWHELPFQNADTLDQDPQKTTGVIATWNTLHRERGARGLSGTFTFVHYTSPHAPWFNENPVADFGVSAADRYDGELAKADRELGRLIAALQALGEWRRTAMVVFADHGTGLGEHGRNGGFLPYEEQLRIPLLIKHPDYRPRRIDDPVAAIDLAPTIAEWTGRSNPGRFHGRSLGPLLRGETERLPPRPVVSLNAFDDSYALLAADGNTKLVWHRRIGIAYEFSLEQDPREQIPHEPSPSQFSILLAWHAAGRGSFSHPYHYRR